MSQPRPKLGDLVRIHLDLVHSCDVFLSWVVTESRAFCSLCCNGTTTAAGEMHSRGKAVISYVIK